ncbi:MAG: HAD family phosphatase [Pseudomonadota bacterium]
MPIKAILWDCDGTLIDSEPLHDECIREVAQQHGAPLVPEDVKRFLGRTSFDIWDYLRHERGLTLDHDGWMSAVNAYYRAHAPTKVPPRPGVETQILLFASMGLRQAVVSNSTRSMLDVSLDLLKAGKMLEFSISADDVGKPKPDPEPYFRAALKLMLPPNQCLVLEDSPAGVRAAKAAGMKVMAWPQHPDLIYDEVDYITDALTTPDWVRIIRRRRKTKPLIARSLAAGLPAHMIATDDPEPGHEVETEREEHPAAAPKHD